MTKFECAVCEVVFEFGMINERASVQSVEVVVRSIMRQRGSKCANPADMA